MSLPQRSIAVVGAGYPNKDGSNRQFAISLCDPGDPVELRPEPRNRHDERAVAVFTQRGTQIGYLPAEKSGRIAQLLGQGKPVRAVFQEGTAFGALVRVSFDGSDPSLPESKQIDEPAPIGDPESGFWPDEEWTGA